VNATPQPAQTASRSARARAKLELPAHSCAALGEILLRFAAAIPDRAP
jgi:hypothetical protein